MTSAQLLPQRVIPTLARRRLPIELLVFALGVAARAIPVIRYGSFNGSFSYDAPVYYAGSSALVWGRTPYVDFTLLHPPGILLADAPFALFGRLTTDHAGFVAAVIASMVVGGINAVLVMRIARRLGLDTPAAVAGGLVYALWFGSVAAEYLPRLEPLGNLLMLSGILALVAATQGDPDDRRHRFVLPALAGAAFGAAVSVKVWWVVPIAVLLGWALIVERRGRTVLVALVGGVAAGILIDGPFLLAARGSMATMVIADQLGRVANNTHDHRVVGYLTLGNVGPTSALSTIVVAGVLAAVALVVLAGRAWRFRAARPIVVLLAVQLVQIMVQPSWFTFYADFLTIALSLTVAAGLQRRRHEVPDEVAEDVPDQVTDTAEPAPPARRPLRWAPPVAVALLAGALLLPGLSPLLVSPFPRSVLTRALIGKRCVMTDAPIGNIQTNTLTRDLRNNCPMWVDVTGRLYGVDRPSGDARHTSAYTAWQPDIVHYLRSGDAVLLVRKPSLIRINGDSRRQIERDGLIVTKDGYSVYRTLRS